jgi:adenylosuccinate lyase
VRAGGDRQELHESIREAAMAAHDRLASGADNPLAQLLADDERLLRYLEPAEIRSLLDPTGHIGDAPERALALVARVKALAPFPRPRTLATAPAAARAEAEALS